MNEIQNNKQVISPNQEPIRLNQLRETLDATGTHCTIHAHDLIIQSAQDGVEQGFGGLANMTPALALHATWLYGPPGAGIIGSLVSLENSFWRLIDAGSARGNPGNNHRDFGCRG